MKPVLLTIVALSCSISLQAQNTAKKDSLLNREMTLEKEYSPTVRDAVKISQLPELREPQAPKTTVEFSNYANPLEIQPKLFPLSPQAYFTNMNYSKYKGYLTGGISSLIDINGDLGYQILNSNQDRLNIFFSHRSSGCNISYLQDEFYDDDTRKFKINDNWGGLNYMHDFDWIKLYADAKYTYSAFNYYGYTIGIVGAQPFIDKNTNQVNNMFEMNLGVASDKANELNYKANLHYTSFGQKYGNTIDEKGSKENRILIDGDVHKLINSAMGIGASGLIKTFSYGNNEFKSLNESATNYWSYSLNPYLYWEYANLNLLLGAKMDVEVGGRNKIIFSPAVRFNYYPSDQVMLYILADGGIKNNSQYNMYYENRYVDPFIRVFDSRSPLDVTAGVKFTPISTLSAGIFGGYKITKDEHFFYSDGSVKGTPMLAGNWITPSYEDANTVKFGADIKYAYQDIFEFGLKGTYYQWTISKDKDPLDMIPHGIWNKPAFEMNMNAEYNLQWLPLRFDLSYSGVYGRKAAYNNFITDSYKMKDIHDLSVKGTYSITPYFSVYASLNNLLFSKYDLWWGYPAQGFNIIGGLSVLF